ncbi:samB [Candida pseudojiufengensis]|uniref:samB n=1 Tax=Candida pseudojiufengensis TaxID=497109 RepID=UPI0022258781|nr:samB [Candida pseudojiufengensis]KAI5965259.1 samB [Candida pseudojiufengensis]
MRDSNFRAISSNKAAVTITTSLYDRRALDVTSDKPLVNSLNYLTYLVSSSAKVRETLSIDGGIERLIEILHECHNFKKFINDNDEKQILIAWKWTLAFQCLVLIGTRGTEKIRQKVVKAGILPIIATVLDNYISLHERAFLHNNSTNTLSNNGNYGLYNLTNNSNSRDDQDENQFYFNSGIEMINQFHSQFQNNSFTNINTTTTNNVNSDQTMINPNVFQQQPPQQEQSENPIYSVRSNTREEDEVEEAIIDGNFLNMNINNNTTPNNTNTINNTNVTNNINNNYYSQFSAAAAALEATSISNNFQSFTYPYTSLKDVDLQEIENSSVEHLIQLLKLPINDCEPNNNNNSNNNLLIPIELEVKRNFITLNLIEKLKEIKENENFDKNHQNYMINFDDEYNDEEYDMDSNLQFLSDLYQRNSDINGGAKQSNNIAVRSFTKSGVVIPKDDDIVWSLQLLAYISKYPYLKDILQNTHIILNMSIRDKQIKSFLENQLKLNLSSTNHSNHNHQHSNSRNNSKSNSSSNSKSSSNSSNTSSNSSKSKFSKRTTIIPKSRKKKLKTTFLERFNPSASNSPQMISSLNDDEDNLILKDDKFDLCGDNNRQNLETNQVQLNSHENNEIEENEEIEDYEEEYDDDEDDDQEESGGEDEERNENFGNETEEDLEESLSNSSDDNSTLNNINFKNSYLKQLFNLIEEIETTPSSLIKKIKYNQLNLKLNKFIEFELKNLSILIINKRNEYKLFLKNKWNYENYKNFDIDDLPVTITNATTNSNSNAGSTNTSNSSSSSPTPTIATNTTNTTTTTSSTPPSTTTTHHSNKEDLDSSLFEIQKLNLFPLVENFTFLSGTDMYYWSGVIMRNSCRRNDLRGGIRQCGNLKCNKWENYPREFSKCRRCKRTKYCSRDCQMKAWHCHRNWCIPSNSSSNSTNTTNTINTTNTNTSNTTTATNTTTVTNTTNTSNATTATTNNSTNTIDGNSENQPG